MSALVLPDPADIRLPELREKVIPRIIEGLAAIEGAGDASQADELRRQIDGYSRFVKDREARRALVGQANLCGLLIAWLVPEQRGKRTDLTCPNADKLSIPRQRLSEYRYLVEADRDYAREQFEEGKTLKAVLRLVEDRQRERDRPASERAVVEQGDCVEWLAGQPECDLLLTDPPYSTDVEDVDAFAARWLKVALDRVKPTGRAYIFVGAYPNELAAYLSVAMPRQVLAWTYRNTIGPSSPKRYMLNWQAILYYEGSEAPDLNTHKLSERFAVQDVAAPDGRLGAGRIHEWEKPVILAERLVEQATNPGDLVLDPFAGTGTHLLAATRLGRVGRGCDLDPEMISRCRARGVEVLGGRVAAA